MFHQIYSICAYFVLDSQEMIVFKTSTQHKKSAAEGVRLLRMCFCLLHNNHNLRVQGRTCTYGVDLMEHSFFELQLCIGILIFKEQSNFWYTDHPEKTALSDQSGVREDGVCSPSVVETMEASTSNSAAEIWARPLSIASSAHLFFRCTPRT